MCKGSLLASAIILAAIVNARANTVTNITFDKFCDGMQLQTADGKNFSSAETGACLQGTSVTGTGSLTRRGKTIKLVVNWRAFSGVTKDLRSYQVQYPFVTGGTWVENPGRHCSKGCGTLNSGTYTVQQ
jgi:hypothetical protein